MSAERNCPRKTFKSIRKTVWKTRTRIRKTIRNVFEKCLRPLSGRSKIFHWHFSTNFKSFSPPRICTTKKFFFSPRGSAGVARKRAEYGFGEYGFKHRTQWVFFGSLSSLPGTQWVPLSLLFVCKSELTEFLAELTEFAAELSEFSLFRNSTLETVFRPFPSSHAKTFGSLCAVFLGAQSSARVSGIPGPQRPNPLRRAWQPMTLCHRQ